MVFEKFCNLIELIKNEDRDMSSKMMVFLEPVGIRIKVIGERMPLILQNKLRDSLNYHLRDERKFEIGESSILLKEL